MKKNFTLLFITCMLLGAQAINAQTSITKLQWEQLASMNTARMECNMFPSGNNFVIIGGHTTGFSRERSAEIYKNGVWTTLGTPHDVHDSGGSVTLDDGRTLIFGGHQGNWGTNGGVTGVDVYDPATESFTNGGTIQGRAMANGVCIGGKAYIVGDYWCAYRGYNPQAIDVWNDGTVSTTDNPQKNYSYPYLMPKSDNSAFLIMSHFVYDYKSALEKLTIADGTISSVTMSVFDTWAPTVLAASISTPQYSIGNGCYLVACKDRTSNDKWAVVKVDADNETADVLVELPTTVNDQGITWNNGCDLLVNQKKGEAYVMTSFKNDDNDLFSYYIATIDYAQGTITGLAYADDLPARGGNAGVAVMSDGRILSAGGGTSDNFSAHKNVFAFTPAGGTANIETVPYNTSASSAVYNLNGQQLQRAHKGLNIIRTAEKTRKIIVK